MARHITDHPRQPTPGRLRQYLALQRAESPHGSIRHLTARRKIEEQPRRMQEFLRIERGRTT